MHEVTQWMSHSESMYDRVMYDWSATQGAEYVTVEGKGRRS
jgi:hypothetical protein